MIPDWPSLTRNRLFYGRDRAVTLSELAETMGTSRRQVERAIEAMRLSGVPVCTGREGVWLSLDSRELRQHADALHIRAARIHKGAVALEATAARHERAQLTLFDVA